MEGWPQELFLDAAGLDSLECAVCTMVVRDAVVHSSCGASFCASCIAALPLPATCPTCRGAIGSCGPILALRDVVLQKRVCCSTRLDTSGATSGDRCTWEGPLEDLQAHRAVCDFELVPCFFQPLLGCDCVRVARGRAAAYQLSQNETHATIIRHLKRAREEAEQALAAAGPASTGAEPAPPPAEEAAVTPAVSDASAALESMLAPDTDVGSVNSAMQRLIDALPRKEDGSAEAAERRRQVSSRVRSYAQDHSKQAGQLEKGRKTRAARGPSGEALAKRAKLCLQTVLLLDGPTGSSKDVSIVL